MPQIEWYYAKDDQPCGPVSPVELKQFAEKGELHEEDLVWRDGMGEWIPAGKIKGLFEANGETGGQGEQPGGEEVVRDDVSPRGEVPAQAIPEPPPAAAELPVRAAPPIYDHGIQEPEPPAEPRSYEDADSEAVSLRHPFDTLADLAREQFAAHFVHSTVVLFRLGGQFGVFIAVAALIFLAAAVGSKAGAINGAVPYGATMPLAAAGVVALLIGQYAAGHLFPAMEELDRTARATLSATGPLDSLGWAMSALGLFSLVGLAAYAMATSTAWPAFLAVAAFVVCQFTAIVAWNPRAVWLNVGPATTPGREAAALICFLGKVLWRLSIVGFGTGILLGSLATFNVAVQIGLPAEPDPAWLGMELISPLCLLLAAVPLPVLGYLGFLACQLAAELVLTGLGGPDRRR